MYSFGVTNMVDAVGTTKYTYHPGGRLWTEDGPWANDTVTNLYNNARLRSDLVLQQPTGLWTNRFTYDAAHRLTSLTSRAGTFTYALGGSGAASPLIEEIALPNSSYVTNTYDSMARLTGTYLKNSSHSTLNSHLYGYNAASQRTQQAFNVGSTIGYSYDDIGQLKFADSATAGEDRGYYYDAAWNLNRRTNNITPTTFSVNSRNELTSVGSTAYSYDDNGNLIDEGLPYYPVYFYYDAENQLVRIENHFYGEPQSKVEFAYDGRGRLRVRKEYYAEDIYTWVLSSETRYLYDGMRVIQERNSSNVPTVSYTRGTDLSGTMEGAGGIGGLLARSHGYSGGNWSTHNFYHADGGGNVTYLVNSSQTLAASYRYDPFGNTISSSGTLAGANVYRFSSKECLTQWGLYYYGYRFYDPNLQRWLNRDPLGDDGSMVYATAKIEPRLEPRSTGELAAMAEAALDPLSTFTRVNLNLYGAVGNNPVNNIDPFGLDFASCYADCIEKYRDPIGNGIAEVCNAGLNKAVGDTGRTGIGGKKPHPTTWQNKAGRWIARKVGKPAIGQVGKVAGRGAIAITIADGFFDLGLLGGCAAACAGE